MEKKVCKQEASTGKVCAERMAAGRKEQSETGGLNQLAQIGARPGLGLHSRPSEVKGHSPLHTAPH